MLPDQTHHRHSHTTRLLLLTQTPTRRQSTQTTQQQVTQFSTLQIMGFSNWVRGPTLGRGSTATVSLALASSSCSGCSDESEEVVTAAAVKTADLSSSAPLQREQRILSCLSSHHVVSYLGFDVTAEEGGRQLYNLFMEYAPGGSIFDEIQRCGGGGLDERRIRSLAKGILAGLSYLHSLGLAHCDVKGRNVLIGSGGEAKIADFGCARWVAAGDDCRRSISGTPAFMAPEVAKGEEQGTEADIWSLGCTVIEMATGRPPWPEAADPVSAVHRIAFSGDIPEFPKWVSDEGKDFLEKCLRRDAGERWTAEELLRHPFVAGQEEEESVECFPPNLNWSSPKCVLDKGLWDEPEEKSDDDEVAKRQGESGPSERISLLAGGGGDDVRAAKREWDDDDWIVVRGGGNIEMECSTSLMVLDDDRHQSPAAEVAGGLMTITRDAFSKTEEVISDLELRANSIELAENFIPCSPDYFSCTYDLVSKEIAQMAHHYL